MHPIPDKAEIAVDFPDKLYIGGFGRDCSFEVRTEPDGVLLHLVRAAPDRREVKIYLHHLLLTDILTDLGAAFLRERIDDSHREPLLAAARRFTAALGDQAAAS